MSIGDAFVTVECDKCGYTEEVRLSALAMHNSWDERNVRPHLLRDGWVLTDEDGAVCPDCSEEEEVEAT